MVCRDCPDFGLCRTCEVNEEIEARAEELLEEALRANRECAADDGSVEAEHSAMRADVAAYGAPWH